NSTIVLFASFIFTSCHQAEKEGGKKAHTEEPRSANTGENDNNDDCGIEDGTQPATVDYSNATTGYSATYSLQAEVENCQVIQIDFNNGGYLDGDHIEPADIDANGDASIDDDRGRHFEVHVNK